MICINICESKLAKISVDLRWLPLVACKGVGKKNYCSIMDGKFVPCLFLLMERLWCFCFALTLCAESAAAQDSSGVSRAIIFLII